MKTDHDTLILHGEDGWRFAFVRNFTIRESGNVWQVLEDIEGEDCIIGIAKTIVRALDIIAETEESYA